MAYNLPLQISIQAPTASNLTAIKKQIEAGLGGVKLNAFDAKSFSKANSEIDNLARNLNRGEKTARSFFDAVEGKARGFAAYTVASTAILKLTNAVSSATREAIKYETELLKISQVTGDSVQTTKEYGRILAGISKEYNVNISKVAQLTRTLAQTGLSFREAAKGAEVLAKTSLLATFDSLTSTTEGLIAVMQTFNLTVSSSADVLEKINAVSKAFAVESGDIVEAIRRTGGAFSSAGGDVEELIALFTSVRSTSRESAETIATGFRTIFGRLQRPKTIEYFKQLGIQLETAEGQFIGPLQAIKNISEGLEELGIRAGSVRFAEVVEQIGGIRQISRVVPLLEEYRKTQQALDIQNKAGVQSAEDLAKAQQGLAFQIGQLKQEFVDLIQGVVNSDSFKFLADVFINTAKAVIRLVSSLKPLLPILAAVAAFKIGRGLTKLMSGGFSLKGVKGAMGFASGGLVPGSGNGDTVPAMLTPGEFVIRKSAVKAIGASKLAGINKYKLGGTVKADGKELKKLYPSLDVGDDAQFEAKVKPVELKKRAGKGSKFDKKTEQVIQGMVESNKSMMWQRFEDGISKAFNVQLVGGNQYLDYPGKPGDAKFIPADATYEKYDDKKGNTNETFLAKLIGSGLYKKGRTVTSYYPEDPSQIAAVVKNYLASGKVPRFADGGEAKKQKDFGKIGLSSTSGSIKASYIDGPNSGEVYATGIQASEKLYSVASSQASKGYGPKLYDIVMEAATEMGGKLVSDRMKVSDAAYNVWKYYLKNRGDVNKTPLNTMDWYFGDKFDTNKFASEDPSTWPPYTDESWALNMGYSKSPALINDASLVQRFAQGGSVGTDTVPALLTPGEFVINKKSAQSFGYGNLKKINKYAKGGIVDGVQYFEDGGTVLSKAEKKKRREKYKADELGTSLSRGERTGGVFKEIVVKYNKLLQEEKALIDRTYQEKIEVAKREGKAIDALLYQRDQAKANATKANKLGRKAATQTAQKTIDKKVERDKLDEASKELKVLPTEDLEFNIDKINMSFLELMFGIQGAVSALKVFGGVEINQEALTSAQVMAGQFDLLADGLKKVNKEGVQKFSRGLFDAGKTFSSVGNSLATKGGIKGTVGKVAGGIGKGISGFAVQFAKWGPKIVSGAMMLAKAFNVASWVSLIGGFVDALFSPDYKKLKDQAIERGDVEAAGKNAALQYNQEFYRGIPIIGGFLAALQPLMPSFMTQLDATGKLAVATAELAATMNGFDKKMKKANDALDLASQRGNKQEIQAALAQQNNVLKDLSDRANAQSAKVQDVQSQRDKRSSKYSLGGISALGSGTASFVSWFKGEHNTIMKGLEQQREAYVKLSQATVERINQVSSMMTSSGVKIIAAGGSIQDAFNHMNDMFGEDNVKEIFGDVTPTAQGLEEAYQNLKKAGEGYDDELKNLKTSLTGAEEDLAAAWPNWIGGSKKQKEEALEQIKVQIAQKEGTIEENEARKKAIVAMATQFNQQIALNKERAVEAAAIAKQIEMSRKLTAVFDDFSKVIGNISDAEDELERASGDRRRLGRKGALDISGITAAGVSSGTLRMNGNQVLRDQNAFNQMLGAVQRMERAQGQEGVFSGFLERTRSDMAQVQKLEAILSPQAVTELRTLGEAATASVMSTEGEVNAEAATTAGMAIREELIKKLRLDPDNISEELNAALLEYGKLIASGVSDVEATQQIKEKLGQEAAKFLDDFQGLYNEVIAGEQKLRDAEIDLANKRLEEQKRSYELIVKTYEAEKAYFEKRFELATDVEDFLNPVAESGPDRSRQLGIRASERRDAQMQELRRNRAQARIGDVGQARANFGLDLAGINKDAADASGQLELLAQRGELLAQTISDEIDIERQHMESLKEVAAAEQAYQQELNDAKGGLTRSIVFGTEEQRADTFNTLNAAAFAASQGSLAGIPEDMRAGIESTLEQFANVVIPGLGLTGRQAQERIATNELMQMGFDPATAAQRAKEMVQEKVPIDKKMAEQIEEQKKVLEKLYADQAAHDKAMRDLEAKQNDVFKASNDIFEGAVNEFRESVNVLKERLGLLPPNPNNPQGQAPGVPFGAPPGVPPGVPPGAPAGAGQGANAGGMPFGQNGGQNPPIPPNQAGQGNPGNPFGGQQAPPPSGPITIDMQGQQDIVVRLPDIQALANGVITTMVYDTISLTFNRIADVARNSNPQNFADLINAFEEGATSVTTVAFGGNSGGGNV